MTFEPLRIGPDEDIIATRTDIVPLYRRLLLGWMPVDVVRRMELAASQEEREAIAREWKLTRTDNAI